jgi:hypothetical protein
MTAMTSSAASDTDSARNRTGAPASVVRPRQPWSTSTPPLPIPPGRWTSSSTTSGLGLADDLDRAVDVGRLADDGRAVVVELGLDPGSEHRVVVDEDKPHRG